MLTSPKKEWTKLCGTLQRYVSCNLYNSHSRYYWDNRASASRTKLQIYLLSDSFPDVHDVVGILAPCASVRLVLLAFRTFIVDRSEVQGYVNSSR
ncbi:MAG: hypothetical protein DWI00_16035 [Planctomycetota bacterium]|nr:MAG: hypothetical protein DWI00_16035 [Planctomycetota bacterium]